MSRRVITVAVLALGALPAAGCRHGAPGAAAATRPAATSRAPARGSTGNACDRKLLTAADAATVLSEPITGTKPIPGDAQTCKFTTGSYSSVSVSLRPGLGRATVGAWLSGKMPIGATPLAHVGEHAAWVGDLNEVIAEQNDVLCDIQVTGLAAVYERRPTEAKQQAIGALCNKIFAAER
jgi:hypothetical protein